MWAKFIFFCQQLECWLFHWWQNTKIHLLVTASMLPSVFLYVISNSASFQVTSPCPRFTRSHTAYCRCFDSHHTAPCFHSEGESLREAEPMNCGKPAPPAKGWGWVGTDLPPVRLLLETSWLFLLLKFWSFFSCRATGPEPGPRPSKHSPLVFQEWHRTQKEQFSNALCWSNGTSIEKSKMK